MDSLIEDSRIIQHEIHDEMKNSYIDYAMSVIVGRALPDVRDGLKPVHRRTWKLRIYRRRRSRGVQVHRGKNVSVLSPDAERYR